MKVILLGLDKRAFDTDSPLASRLKDYGGMVDELNIIIPNSEDKKVNLSPKTVVWGVKSKNKVSSVIKLALRARKVIKKNRKDTGDIIITTRDTYALGMVAYLLSKIEGVVYEIQIHGFEKYNRLRRYVSRFVIRKADSVRVVSERLRNTLSQDMKVEKEKITVAPIYIDWEAIHNSKSNIILDQNIKNKFKFLYVGRLVKVKNIEAQIFGLRSVVDRGLDAVLLIVGDGPEQHNLKKVAEDNKVKDRVIFLGEKYDPIPYYKGADCLLLTSTYEGYGITPIEAASVGLPIIMTDVGNAGETIKSGEHISIISVNNQEALVNSMERVVERGRRNKSVSKFDDVIKRLKNKDEILELVKHSWGVALGGGHTEKMRDEFTLNIGNKFGSDYEESRWFANEIDKDRFYMIKKVIKYHTRTIEYSNCFELGPGPGTWTSVLIEENPKASFTLLDLSETMRGQFNKKGRNKKNVDYFIGDFESYDASGSEFDLFFSSRAIEYIKDKTSVINKIFKLIKPGGKGLIITKTPHTLKMKLLRQKSEWHHKFNISYRELREILETSGFENIKIYPATVYIPLLGRVLVLNKIIWKLLCRFKLNIFTSSLTESYIVSFKKPS